MKDFEKLQKLIDGTDNIVFFGGAGVSTPSGIKDFRSKDGLYSVIGKNAEYMLSSEFFYTDPRNFYSFYKNNMNFTDKQPNIIHKYLTKLERKGKLKAIITQNIDGLHQKSGSKNIFEIHGTINENHCLKCNRKYNASYIFSSKDVPKCTCGGIIKPNVVLYGERLPDIFDDAINLILQADLLIVAGTSLKVEPASSLVKLFKKKLVIINNEKTPYDFLATLVINNDLEYIFKNLK